MTLNIFKNLMCETKPRKHISNTFSGNFTLCFPWKKSRGMVLIMIRVYHLPSILSAYFHKSKKKIEICVHMCVEFITIKITADKLESH